MTRKIMLFLALALSLPFVCAAQNPPATPPAPAIQATASAAIGPAKIAFMSIQGAIATCDEGKREAANLEQYVNQKSADLQNRQKELEALKTKLEVQGSKLTDEARAELADQIETQDTAVQRFQQDTQKDIDGRRQKLQNAIARKMLPVIEKVAKEKGVNVVQFLDVAQIFGYVDPALVITDDVIKAYNVAYPAVMATPAVKK